VGSGYFSPPTVTLSGGGGTGAGVTITAMRVSDVTINNTGAGATVVSNISFISQVGSGAQGSASMGIGRVNVVGFGSGYNLPPTVTVTPIGVSGAGASVVAGLGLTSSNITITNSGYGYSSIPGVTISSSTPVSIAASAISGVGITGLVVTNPGIGYSGSIPSVTITTPANNFGSGAAAVVSNVIVTNVYITNPGSGYTAADLASLPIATFSPTGTAATVGFGVSTILLTNLGVGYTSISGVAVTIGNPNISTGTTATAIASLGFAGILPGPGVNTTGETRVYYVASVSANSIGISTGIGIGTLTSFDVADNLFSSDPPVANIGGRVSQVLVVSPGSGYTSTSVLTASSFDGVNIGTGFSFTTNKIVNNYQFSDVMILQSVGSASTTCDFMEYGTIANQEILGTFSSDISGNNARLLFTPTYRNNTIKISSQSITN
jgi:CBS domain-containing protein